MGPGLDWIRVWGRYRRMLRGRGCGCVREGVSYLDFEKGLIRMFGISGEKRAGQKHQFLHSALLALCGPCVDAEVFDSLRADEGTCRVHYQYDFFAGGEEGFERGADGGDIIGEGFGMGRTGAGAGEGDDVGGVGVGY